MVPFETLRAVPLLQRRVAAPGRNTAWGLDHRICSAACSEPLQADLHAIGTRSSGRLHFASLAKSLAGADAANWIASYRSRRPVASFRAVTAVVGRLPNAARQEAARVLPRWPDFCAVDGFGAVSELIAVLTLLKLSRIRDRVAATCAILRREWSAAQIY